MDSERSQPEMTQAGPTTLRRLLWLSFLKTAIVPLLFIELVFLGIFVVSSLAVYRENVAAQSDSARTELDGIVAREAENIAVTLGAVERNTNVFANLARRALLVDYQPSAREKARYGWSPSGEFYSRYDNGTTASYLSAYRPIGPRQIESVWKLSVLDPYMIDTKNNDPLVVSIYANTRDNYNRIYPYFDVLEQYPKNMRISDYNFYYMADARHNPQRKAVWTNPYADPAGHGWIVSSIAPVWIDNRLEAVVGQDVTLETIAARLRGLDLPWNAFAMLVDHEGNIVAMPPAGEKALGLKELTSFSYDETVKSDTFKPAEFDLAQRPDTRLLAQTLAKYQSGRLILPINGRAFASFSRIAGLDWSLVIVAPEREIFAQANRIRDRQAIIGWIMAAMLVLFYIIFFLFLYSRADRMSVRMAEPIAQLAQLVQRIGQGQFRQQFNPTHISEIDHLGQQLVWTGDRLGDAYDTIVAQERQVAAALQRQRQASDEQARFLRIMSHEIRTPLAIIDSGAQILDRKADALGPADLRDRASRMQRAVERISRLLQKLGQTIERAQDEAPEGADQPLLSLGEHVAAIAAEVVPADRLAVEPDWPLAHVAETVPVALALRAVLDNAVRYAIPGGKIRVAVARQDNTGVITVTDDGPGIPSSELASVGERFFRGSNAATVEGAGVGIYVARKIMESSGGTLDISSAAAGTVATLRAPLTGTDDGEA